MITVHQSCRIFSGLLALLCAALPAMAAEEYVYDAVHSSVSFKARHLDISWIHGRFNEVDGKFSIDREDASKSSFQLTIKADSVDTAVRQFVLDTKGILRLGAPPSFGAFLQTDIGWLSHPARCW